MITIESIELSNFMCHSNFKIEFSKMVICIGGRNGSGKSAIMIALGIVFGQRASALERGNSFKNLIKTGCNQSIIKVKINNHKKYKRNQYGSTIIVEKRLRENGSRLSIMNDQGRVVSSKKCDLDNIIADYKLKFDNPLNFLTQEQSKKFLNISKPELLYDFYYRGTEFKDIHDEIEESLSRLCEMEERMETAIREKNDLSVELEIQEKNLKFLEMDLDAMMKNLEIEEGWLSIKSKREEIEKIEAEILECEEIVFNNKKERKKISENMNTTYNEVPTKEIEEKINKVTLSLREVENDCLDYQKQLSLKKEELERIKKRNNLDDLVINQENIKNSLEEKKKLLLEKEEEKIKIDLFYEQEKKIYDESVNKIFALQKQIEFLKSNIYDSNQQSTMKQIKMVEDEIKRYNFRDKIVGPICNYVNLKDPKWFKPVSVVLKNSLNNYIVFNDSDKKN